jgi:hypothetical protein
MNPYAIVFLAWGEPFLQEVHLCLKQSEKFISGLDTILITDRDSSTGELEGLMSQVIRVDFKQTGLLRKTELHEYLPDTYAGFLLLDSDTIVIGDLSLGFRKAEIHGIAVAPAPHYSLDAFWGFDRILQLEKIPLEGQLQYNTGVIFFKNTPEVKRVFQQWGTVAQAHQNDFENDQPFFTLAMEQLQFNPYTLSISYNYRGFGDAISGDVRIWHSHGRLPEKINTYETAWPPRRAWPDKVTQDAPPAAE